MPIIKLIEFLKRHMRMTLVFCYITLVALVLIDGLFIDKSKAHTAPEHIMGYWSVFGFGACVVIVVFSKWFGHLGIMAREDYYERRGKGKDATGGE
jgi:short subunit fatty acids transporter